MSHPEVEQNVKIEGSKPIEVAQLWLGIAQVLLILGASAAGAWKWVSIDSRMADLDRRHREVEVVKAETEALSVVGQVLDSEVYLQVGDRSVPVCPVFVTLQNVGQVPVRVTSLEFRVFTATLGDVSALTTIDVPKNDISLTAGNDIAESALPDKEILGVLLSNSANWIEKKELAQNFPPSNEMIPSGQSRLERLHVLAPTMNSSLLTKIEVTVHTEKATHRWFGFTNTAVCRPIAFPAAMSE